MFVAFSVTPLGTGEASARWWPRPSGWSGTAAAERADAMTTIEGDWDEAMAVVERAMNAVAALAPRVGLVLKADIRPGVPGALTAKVEAVERYLRP